MKYGQPVLFIQNTKDFKDINNGGAIAAAIVVAPWSAGTMNLRVLTDGTASPLHITSVTQATSKETLFNGNAQWATPEQLEGWGLDLTSYYSMNNAVAEHDKAKEVQAVEGDQATATE